MKETPYSFQYTWEDLKPVRALAVAIYASQALGAIVGLVVHHFPDLFVSALQGATGIALPSFFVGLAIQSHVRPGTIVENAKMVRRLGLVSAAFTAFAFVIPLMGMGDAR